MVGRRGSVCNGLPGLASEIALTHPFLRPGTRPLGADEQRRKVMSRTTSWVLVAALHVLFFFSFVLGIRPFDLRNRAIIEWQISEKRAVADEKTIGRYLKSLKRC